MVDKRAMAGAAGKLVVDLRANSLVHGGMVPLAVPIGARADGHQTGCGF
jgi:hypothetical protein